MTVRRRRSDRSGRSKLHSPGRPDSARRKELVRLAKDSEGPLRRAGRSVVSVRRLAVETWVSRPGADQRRNMSNPPQRSRSLRLERAGLQPRAADLRPLARQVAVFWAAIATGRSSEDAARDAGVSPPGSRWFRRSGGMPPSHLSQSAKPLSGRYLSFEEREEIALLRAQGRGIRHIACRLKRATVDDLPRVAAQRGDPKRWPGLPSNDGAVAY